MTDKSVVVVAGDITIDWLMYPVEPQDRGANWQLYLSLHNQAMEAVRCSWPGLRPR